MAEPMVITVVLNCNKRDDTLAALESLVRADCPNHRIIVLDVASTDGSAGFSGAYPSVPVIDIPTNLGYAGNNNVGIRAACELGADWIFVLNNDAIVAPDCLARLLEVALRDDGIGIAGPTVYHYDEPDTIQSAGGTTGNDWSTRHLGQNEPDRGQFTEPRAVDWVSGCGLLVRREVVDRVGALDERFFCYWEEIEWCLRARKAGWQVTHVPAAKMWHKGVQRDYRPGPSVTYYSTRNRFLLLRIHRAPLRAWIRAWAEVSRTLASWSIRPRWRPMKAHRDAMWQGALDFLRRRFGPRPNSEKNG